MCFIKVGGNSNKRLGAMNKLTNVVHSGWMIKSPPEQKLQSPLKIFRAVSCRLPLKRSKWKQRFFVLHKPSGSLPDQYELSYYSSEQCSKKKGSIDLEQCEQIIESLDSEQYPYLLAIKTVCRSKGRTYYLATNSEEEMSTWVQCLCRVCSLKQEDSPTDVPDGRHSLHGVSSTSGMPSSAGAGPTSSVRSTSSVAPSVASQPPQTASPRPSNVTSSTSSTNSHPAPSTSPQSYVFLNECTTGKRNDRYGRTDSIDSVPEYQAPPPPAKRGTQLAAIENDSPRSSLLDSVFDVYDHPPAAGVQETSDMAKSGGQELHPRPKSNEFCSSEVSLDDDAFYKVPPVNGHASLLKAKRGSESSDVVDFHAAVPLPMPRRSPRSTCSSVSDRPSSIVSTGRPVTENYDVPPPRHVSTSSQEGVGLNNSPPTPPLRPPKPHGLMAQSPYQNLPTTGKSCDNSLSAVPAAPKQCGAPFSYDVPRSTPFVSPPRDPSVLDIAPPAPAPRSCGPASGHAYLNTVPGLSGSPSVPPFPDTYLPVRNGERGEPEDLVYADMDGSLPGHSKLLPTSDLVYADMAGVGGAQEPSQAPPLAPRPPARSGPLGLAKGGPDSDAQNIWTTHHTKSFIRSSQVSNSPSLPARPPPLEPRRLPLPARTEFASSSEDDEDLSVDGNNTHHDLSVVRMSTVPAAPDIDTEPELKYLDLALDTPPDPSRPQAAACHGKPTEYREIDFVKTRALQDVKKARDFKK